MTRTDDSRPGSESLRRTAGLAAAVAAAALAAAPAAQPSHPADRGARAADAAKQRAMDRDESRALAESAAQEVARLRQQLLALGQGETQADRSLEEKGLRLAALNAAESELTERIGRNQSELSRLLGALQLYRRNPPPALLVTPKNATNAVNAAILLRALEPELAQRARALSNEAAALRSIRRRIVLANGEIVNAEVEAQDRRSEIERLIAQKRTLESTLERQADTAATDVHRLVSEARSLGVRVEDVEEADGQDHGVRLTPPVPGPPVRRFRQPDPGGRRSEGWTWRLGQGTVVRAPADGRIDYAGTLKGWGVVVILRAPGAYRLVLAGLGAADAHIGETVRAGEPVGRMAATTVAGEDKTVRELYFELRKGETPIDPARWLSATAARATLH